MKFFGLGLGVLLVAKTIRVAVHAPNDTLPNFKYNRVILSLVVASPLKCLFFIVVVATVLATMLLFFLLLSPFPHFWSRCFCSIYLFYFFLFNHAMYMVQGKSSSRDVWYMSNYNLIYLHIYQNHHDHTQHIHHSPQYRNQQRLNNNQMVLTVLL